MLNTAEISKLFIFLLTAVPASVSDARTKMIPDICTASGITGILLLRLIFHTGYMINTAAVIISAPAFFMTVRILTDGRLGMGDVKFSALTGIFLGFPGWFTAAAIASFSGLLFAAAGMASGKMNRYSKIPFAPFLTAGSIGAFFLNPWLMHRIMEQTLS